MSEDDYISKADNSSYALDKRPISPVYFAKLCWVVGKDEVTSSNLVISSRQKPLQALRL